VGQLEVLAKLLEKNEYKNHYLLMQVKSQLLMVMNIRAGAAGPNNRSECREAGGPGQIAGEKNSQYYLLMQAFQIMFRGKPTIQFTYSK
jgi:hypothetical protein